jgi:hypothetical protein
VPPPEGKAAEAHGSAPSDRAAAEPAASEIDLPKLPQIESIDAATDIRAFLRNGIPQDLSRAALRRAWTADPAIRDFVGLAENAWDFNDPNGMGGFGPLDYSAEQVEALVRRIVGGVMETAEKLADPIAEAAEGARSGHESVGLASTTANAAADPRPPESSAAAELPSSSVASQPVAASEEETFLPRRTHGGALPR